MLTVTVRNEASGAPARRRIGAAAVRRIARAALLAEGVVRGELSVLVTRDARIRALNSRFRGKDKATNVLSFPQEDPFAARGTARRGTRAIPRRAPLIGDVVVSVDTVARQGLATGSGFRYTFAYYLVHGILHLLGHDHHRPAEARRMYRRTREILAAAGEDRR